jgi:hypothetical protein
MDVFVIPIGAGKYALYCEPASAAAADVQDGAPADTLVGKVRDRFARVVRAAEERQHRHLDGPDAARGVIERGKDRALGWVAQKVAEQRLLWNLRTEVSAVILHPQDMTFEQAMELARRILKHDHARHKRWAWIDGIMAVVTGVLLGPVFILIPGIANIPFLYFAFRGIGHWFSMRGAAHGLDHVSWSGRPCPPLGELREISALDPGVREARVHDIAARLRLQHLSTFVERVTLRHLTPSA